MDIFYILAYLLVGVIVDLLYSQITGSILAPEKMNIWSTVYRLLKILLWPVIATMIVCGADEK